MKQQKYKLLGKLTAIVLGGALLTSGIAAAQENADTPGTEVLTRGPVHEAFAGTVSFNPEVGILVDQAPPALIEEVPPEQRLEGDNVTWIPGYWAWDEDQSDFLWISGIWRNLPPGRQWVPGYWAETEGRHQWTSGYWEDAETTEVTYLPEPPKSLEVGPNVEATSNDQSWIPGNWVYRDDRYAWRTGYWAPARENWAWTPAYYRWTQRGHVYVDGYWDYPVARRGVVFAPVRFDVGYRSRPDFYYTPAAVISLSVFTNHLFLRPNYGHYYYGDYYEPRYRDRGFYASYSYNSSRYGYDPIYSHNRWENRNDRNWENGRRDYFEYRRDNQDARPPRTWASLSSRQGDRNRDDFEVAQRFDRVVSNRENGRQRFQKVEKQDRERYVSQRQEIRKFGKDREQLETRGDKRAATGDKESKSVTKEKISRSPVLAKKSDRSDKDGGPPERLQARASEKDARTEKSEKADNTPKSASEDTTKTKRPKEGTTDREADAGSKGKTKTESTPETRVKPGEKRAKEPMPQDKEKRQADPDQGRKAMPGEKRQAEPSSEPKAKPQEKRQADPTPERKEKSVEKREAAPSPERKANPAPKREAQPDPERKAKPDEKRDSTTATARKVNKEQSRQVAQPAEQKAVKKDVSQRQIKERTEAQPQKAQARQQTAPKQAKAQPERQVKQRQESQPQTAGSREQAAPKQAKAKPSSPKTATAEELEKKKKAQAE